MQLLQEIISCKTFRKFKLQTEFCSHWFGRPVGLYRLYLNMLYQIKSKRNNKQIYIAPYVAIESEAITSNRISTITVRNAQRILSSLSDCVKCLVDNIGD